MKTLILLSLLCHFVSPVRHSLEFKLSYSHGIRDIPEFVAVALVDKVQMGYCDSNGQVPQATTDWMDKLIQKKPQHLAWYTTICLGNQHTFKATIENLMQRFNHTQGIHIFQRMNGCEWDDKTDEVNDLPSVSLLQKSPSSPVSCHATGFYPDRAMMFWRKDGEEIHEDVDHGEILPNHDGSFQMSVDLDLSSVPPEDWRRYDCVFHLSGVKDDIITKLDKAVIRTNWVSPSQFPAGAVIGVVVGLLLLLTLCITGLCIWRRNHHGFKPANTSDSSLSSDNTSASK
ncbi:major histocompatibility complex class I-related gene protein-like isoform X3 [Epinephelus moara]|uniref:major histocompatibility complex class I-related gene protein-like isoform X3 n=1 Tax=Epinephelus moara TaxID=300413 RepID=UPI00214E5D24|nr:major histocompatibility complex class I-related gene protein-like isoform X3 [Epinephelus moara]